MGVLVFRVCDGSSVVTTRPSLSVWIRVTASMAAEVASRLTLCDSRTAPRSANSDDDNQPRRNG